MVSRLLLQANSGGGKSWAIRRILEQTHGMAQHIVLDVEDEFHTLREKFDYILARQGGDCPVETRSAGLLARRLLELGVSAIINLYDLKAHDRVRFVRLFLESMMSAPRNLWHPTFVVIDEAHTFCPQTGEAESAQAVIDLETRGRKRSFCGILATQRISKLHKDAAAECNNKLIGRSSLDLDMRRSADELGVSAKDKEGQHRLRMLPAGQFYAFGPALSAQVVELKVGGVVTTHPRPGQQSAPPAPPREKVKAVLAKLADLPKEAEQEAQDLAGAKAKIRELERALKNGPPPERVQVPFVPEEVKKSVENLGISMKDLRSNFERVFQALSDAQRVLAASSSNKGPQVAPAHVPLTARPSLSLAKAVYDTVMRDSPTLLPKGERQVLTAIAQYAYGATREQLSVLTGYKRSSRDAYLQRLKERGHIAQGTDGAIVATELGIAALGNDFKPLPIGSDLRQYWLDRLPEGERAVLSELIDAYPGTVSRDSIDEATGYKRSSRDAYIQRLKARKLVVISGRGVLQASKELFDE